MCEFMKALQKPFPTEDIEWRVGSTNADKTKGIALAYITNRAIMSRLDDLFGPFGWRNEYREWKGTSQLCGISIKYEGEWVTKWDGADDSATESVKGGLSDAMKRAGYQWGIGRYLYKLENMWVPIKQQGRSYVLSSEPKLPEWALPEGYEQKFKEFEHVEEDLTIVGDDILNEMDKATKEFVNAPPAQKQSQAPQNPQEQTGNYVSDGQVKMLYAKWKQTIYKTNSKDEVLELLSAHLEKHVSDFKFLEKPEINKVIKWFDEHKDAA